MNNYVIELPFLRYDVESLLRFLDDETSIDWETMPRAMFRRFTPTEEGYYTRDKKLIKFSKIKQTNLFSDIIEQLPELGLNIEKAGYNELPPETYLRPHSDGAFKMGVGSLIIPLRGNFEKGPIFFHSEKNIRPENLLYKHVYTTATIINTDLIHSAINSSAIPRLTLYFKIFNLDWSKIQSIVETYK